MLFSALIATGMHPQGILGTMTFWLL